jgi:hypothetical protein
MLAYSNKSDQVGQCKTYSNTIPSGPMLCNLGEYPNAVLYYGRNGRRLVDKNRIRGTGFTPYYSLLQSLSTRASDRR